MLLRVKYVAIFIYLYKFETYKIISLYKFNTLKILSLYKFNIYNVLLLCEFDIYKIITLCKFSIQKTIFLCKFRIYNIKLARYNCLTLTFDISLPLAALVALMAQLIDDLAKMWGLRLLLLFLQSVQGQYIPTTIVDNAGNTWWSATVGAPRTAVSALPHIPTLVYNCNTVPALCANVGQVRPGAAVGQYPAPGFEAFGWDPDKDRKEKRREKRCPDNWKTKKRGGTTCKL